MSRAKMALVAAVLGLMIGGSAMAQDQLGARPPGRGNFDPAQMRDRMMTDVRDRMGVSDDEWKVIAPKIDHLMTAQSESRSSGGGFGFLFGGSRGGGRTDREPRNDVERASNDLQRALDDKGSAPEDIARKLAAYREARDRARANFLAAQKEIKDLLTQRQEAILVVSGMLE